jgi:hypothetical protein
VRGRGERLDGEWVRCAVLVECGAAVMTVVLPFGGDRMHVRWGKQK